MSDDQLKCEQARHVADAAVPIDSLQNFREIAGLPQSQPSRSDAFKAAVGAGTNFGFPSPILASSSLVAI